MPYISMTTSKKFTDAERETISRGFGKLISILPNKSEPVLMVDVADGHDMFFRGARGTYAYINVGLYTASPFDAKAEFSKAVFELLEKEAGIAPRDVYMNFSEYENWASGGALK